MFHYLPHPLGHQRLVPCERKSSETRKLTSLRILVVNTVTNRVARLLGKDETVRWMNLAVYQGQPAKKSLNTAVSVAI